MVAKKDPSQGETGQDFPYLGKLPFPNLKGHKGLQPSQTDSHPTLNDMASTSSEPTKQGH